MILQILPFEYKGFGPTPIFNKFISHVTEGYDDRKKVFQAMFRLAIEPDNSTHKFFYMHDKGGSGKLTVARLINALAGDSQTTSTTLSLLGSNQFEHSNFVSQKVVLVNDPGRGSGDHSALRCLVGGDKPVLRSKNVQGTGEGQIIVTVYMQSNCPFQSKDTSGAITRRIISIPIDKKPDKIANLISLDVEGNWVGDLVPELGFIMHWVLSMSALEAKQVVMNIKEEVPSLKEEQEKFALSSNSVEAFVNEYVIKGEGATIGYKKDINDKNSQIARENGHFFYFYLDRDLHVVSHNDFSKFLVETSEKKGFIYKKVRRKGGSYISGIVLDPAIFSAEYITGEVKEKEHKEQTETANQEVAVSVDVDDVYSTIYPNTFVSPESGQVHKSLTPNLKEKYLDLFKKTPLKEVLNEKSKEVPVYCWGYTFRSLYRESRTERPGFYNKYSTGNKPFTCKTKEYRDVNLSNAVSW